MPISEQDIQHIHNLNTLLAFLRDNLRWEIRDDLPTEDLFYDYTAEEMRFDQHTAEKVKVRQLAPFIEGQPWGIFLVETDSPRVYITHLRQILRALAPGIRTRRPDQKAWDAENLLFICAPPQYDRFTFAHFKGDKTASAKLATFGWDKDELGLRTLREFNLPALEWYDGSDPEEWIANWATAFDVAKVTKRFFQEYEELFAWIKTELRVARGVTQRLTEERRHFFAQRLMNRLLFLCFLQKKRWLDYNPRYLFDVFDHCVEIDSNFYDDYLYHVLFLGLNRATHRAVDGMPETELRQRIGLLPFLNGGLFEQADEWDYYKKLDISNEAFDRILGPDGLLRRYNFTVTESTPLDVQVAIDPEMLGRVYEQLISERNKLGAFYTHPVEVRLMVRESLKAFLSDRAAFPDAASKIAALVDQEDAGALNENEALEIYRALLDIKVCDLAIGSGAFPVAMMREIVELLRRLARTIAQGKLHLVVQDKLDDPQSLYDLKLYVIQNCIFGADIDAFSVEIAKLRFWLSLVVDNPIQFASRAEFERRVAEIRPLPNLLYKIRVGDSVLAKVGKINWDVVEYKALKGAKRSVVKTARNMYDLMSLGALGKILALKQNYFLKSDVEKQKLQQEIDKAEIEFEHALLGGQVVPKEGDKNKYILWQVHFAEVFQGKGSGFDIMIANPPYVRQELLNKEYKDELADTYESLFPDYHADKKSDLFVYFYLRALFLLKAHGVLCFICSNSWLDVGYGAPLQEFLLKHTRILGIYDNSAKRSFETADINTTINVFQRAEPEGSLKNTARFVMFRRPFEDVATPENLRAIATTKKITSTQEYRVFPVKQMQLLGGATEGEKYRGSKWGAVYLRAPDIYFTVMKALEEKPKLKDIADLHYGIKTGANEFFYLHELDHTDEKAIREFGIAKSEVGSIAICQNECGDMVPIERTFLKRTIRTPRECYSISIPQGIGANLFICHKAKQDLKGTFALRYIQWGEEQGFNKRPTCAGRPRWYDLTEPKSPRMLWPSAFFERFMCYEVSDRRLADKLFYLISGELQTSTRAFLNSTLVAFLMEVNGYQLNHGGIYVDLYWLDNLRMLTGTHPEVEKTYGAILHRDIELAASEAKRADRQALDAAVLRALGLPESMLGELYETVTGMVGGRIHKARRQLTKQGRTDEDQLEE